tara:strand:+ start:56 stop:766 length:711 start_codon:yes stop_codon:yes gene_type:complete
MLIEQYCNMGNGNVTFTRQQASDFAKKVSDDFNPLHNTDAKRFCVPGDLLFSMVLANYGTSTHMKFNFSGMVTEDVCLSLPNPSPLLVLNGDNGKEYLTIERSGETSTNSQLIDNLTRSYVTFSGHTFPHILMPLLEQQQVMINPARPMVMYQSMLIDLDRLDLVNVELTLDPEKTSISVSGKRGHVCLAFHLISNDQIIGRGEKHMVVSGLKPYEKSVVDQIIDDYSQWKSASNA